MLGKIISDLLLFSILESFIFCLYFKKFGNCKEFKHYEIFIIGAVNCIISQVIPPLLYQLIMVIWMGFYLFLFKNKTLLVGLYLSAMSMLLLLTIEMLGAMAYEYILNINFMELDKIKLFITIIPMKLFEIFFILGGDRMKAWYSEIEKRK